jgi:predicted cupin superfamily sugar epimerase
MDKNAKRIVERFGLIPHPEGGHFREVYRAPLHTAHPGIPAGHDNRRSAGTLIYFLLAGAEFSAFHRVRWSDEIWHLYAGGPLELHTIGLRGDYAKHVLTTDLGSGEPTAVVPAGALQAARLAPAAAWAFGGCTVAPGFDFADFAMPPRAELLAAHARHAAIIRELTR